MLNLMMISRRNINDLACKFPTQTNRELIPPNGEQNSPDQGTAQDRREFGGELFREMLLPGGIDLELARSSSRASDRVSLVMSERQSPKQS